MEISERARRDAYTGREQALGENTANTTMELLPNQPADQLVTRTDMHAFGTGLSGQMAELRAELKGEMSELRGEMAELRAEMKSNFANAKVETQRLIGAGMAANTVAVVVALLT